MAQMSRADEDVNKKAKVKTATFASSYAQLPDISGWSCSSRTPVFSYLAFKKSRQGGGFRKSIKVKTKLCVIFLSSVLNGTEFAAWFSKPAQKIIQFRNIDVFEEFFSSIFYKRSTCDTTSETETIWELRSPPFHRYRPLPNWICLSTSFRGSSIEIVCVPKTRGGVTKCVAKSIFSENYLLPIRTHRINCHNI